MDWTQAVRFPGPPPERDKEAEDEPNPAESGTEQKENEQTGDKNRYSYELNGMKRTGGAELPEAAGRETDKTMAPKAAETDLDAVLPAEPGTALEELERAVRAQGGEGALGRTRRGGISGERPGGKRTGETPWGEREPDEAGPDEGFAWLYRHTARAAAGDTGSAPGAARTAWEAREEDGSAALTAEEFDRAVRRDSRRYDGGLTIY